MRIVTKVGVNIRSGPSMIFEVVNRAKKGTELHSFEYRKDSNSVGWYRIEDGWVCAEYVTAAKDAPANDIKFNLRHNDEDDDDDEEDEIEEDDDVDPSDNQQGGQTVTFDPVQGQVFGDNNGGIASNIVGSSQQEPQRSPVEDNGVNTATGIATNILNRKVFGVPYQYRKSVDTRVDINGTKGVIGVEYLTMMAEAPYISIMPGKPLFLPDLDDSKKEEYFKFFSETISGMANETGRLLQLGDTKLASSDAELKYFGFDSDYNTYMQYVNTICWMIAITMGISESLTIPGYESDTFGKAGNFDYQRWRLSNVFAGKGTPKSVDQEADTEDNSDQKQTTWQKIAGAGTIQEGAMEAWSAIMEQMSREPYYTDFYISPNISYSESFSNNTSPSMLEGAVNQTSEFAKEIGFLMNAGVGAANANENNEAVAKAVKDMSGGLMKGKGVLSRILGAASTVISGYNIVFPDIWKGSDYNRSFNIEVNLKTPYGTKEAIFMDIMVPLAHWLALAMPRQQSINSYGAPFLVRCFIPGFCAVDMGIVESMNINKGGDGSAWSVEGFPLEITLNITIKELYASMMQSNINFIHPVDIYNFAWNNGFLDYISVLGGLNLKQSEARKRFQFIKAIIANKFSPEYLKNRAYDVAVEDLRNAGFGFARKITGGWF